MILDLVDPRLASSAIMCDECNLPSRKPRGRRVAGTLRAVILGAFLVFLVLLVVWITRAWSHRRAYRQVQLAVLRLATNRPPDVPEDRWTYCVHWTWNLHCGYSYRFETEELRRFADELNRKLDRPVKIDVIDWIWDEYLRYEPSSRSDAHHRPTSRERFRQAYPEGKIPVMRSFMLPF